MKRLSIFFFLKTKKSFVFSKDETGGVEEEEEEKKHYLCCAVRSSGYVSNWIRKDKTDTRTLLWERMRPKYGFATLSSPHQFSSVLRPPDAIYSKGLRPV